MDLASECCLDGGQLRIGGRSLLKFLSLKSLPENFVPKGISKLGNILCKCKFCSRKIALMSMLWLRGVE
jgi:hypothetical protein